MSKTPLRTNQSFTGSRSLAADDTPRGHGRSRFKRSHDGVQSQTNHSYTGSEYFAADNTPRSHRRSKFKRSEDGVLYLSQFRDLSDTDKPQRRKHLSKNRIYLQTPQDWYNYNLENIPKDRLTSSRIQHWENPRKTIYDWEKESGGGRKIVFDQMFQAGNHRNPRKGMIIDEKPPEVQRKRPRRPDLPGNLSLDNLEDHNLDWRTYRKITWNEIMESHMDDVNKHRVNIQTMPQKEHWLASIDNYNYNRPSNRYFPHFVSPRLFNHKVTPTKTHVAPKYVSQDKQGNVYYIVGSGDVTSKEYRPFVLPELDRTLPKTPPKLNF